MHLLGELHTALTGLGLGTEEMLKRYALAAKPKLRNPHQGHSQGEGQVWLDAGRMNCQRTQMQLRNAVAVNRQLHICLTTSPFIVVKPNTGVIFALHEA